MTAFRKLHQFKRKKPIYKSRFFWIGIATLLVISGLIYLIAFVPFFQVEEVEVTGNQDIESKEIKKIVNKNISRELPFTSSRSVFLVRVGKIQDELNEAFPVLDNAKIKRVLPSSLKVTIKERKPVGVFVAEKNYLIDKKGVIFEATSSTEGFTIEKKVEKVKLGERIIEEETMNKILTIKSRLEDIKFKSAVLKKESRLDIITQAGWKAYFDLSKDWEWQTTELKLALEREISETEWKDLKYIDLRFDRVFYK